MCCLAALVAVLGPRIGILIWWIAEPARWNLAFDTFIWPFLGFLFLPFTTLMYVLVIPSGIEGFDLLWLGLAVVIDVASWTGGGYGNRGRMPGGAATA